MIGYCNLLHLFSNVLSVFQKCKLFKKAMAKLVRTVEI